MRIVVPAHWAQRLSRLERERDFARYAMERAADEMAAIVNGILMDNGVTPNPNVRIVVEGGQMVLVEDDHAVDGTNDQSR